MQHTHIQLPRLSPLMACALLLALTTTVIVIGHDSLRAARVLVLMAPLFIWLLWPLSEGRWRSFRFLTVTAMLSLFVLDGIVRTYLLNRYDAVPESAMVLSAIANTTSREMAEYADAMGHMLWLGLMAALLAVAAVTALTARSNAHQLQWGNRVRWALLALLVLCSVGLLSKPWRKYHPTLYWSSWVMSVANLRASLTNKEAERAQLLANAKTTMPFIAFNGPSTIVLVLSDSVNRDNMSLYGYQRDTTPELLALSKEDPERWRKLSHAWSAAPGTLSSLSVMFSFGMRTQFAPVGDTQHILALARQAGYRTWWMSNHDDIAIEQQHARLADSVEMINRQPGRGTANLDGDLLVNLEKALADPASHKLIIVHMLGAHPDYSRRFPPGWRRSDAGEDVVEKDLERAGRPLWLREMRQSYDTAIHYHDSVVAQTARMTRSHTPGDGDAAWVYLSDHGQEVGHVLNRAGHSSSTEAGYRIPTLVWRSSGSYPEGFSDRPFRGDWVSWLLADLMHLDWTGMRPQNSVLRDTYAWAPPPLPLRGVNFNR